MSATDSRASAPLARENTAAVLLRITHYEATLERGMLNRVLRTLGRTALFSALYRRIGPRLDTWLHRRFGGQVSSRLYGLPTLLLLTTGAKSGLPRTSPLVYVREGDEFFVVGTNFGQGHHPAWTGNLLSHPLAALEIGAEKISVTSSLVEEPEFARQWERFVSVYPGYANYLARSGRTPRMFRLQPRD